MSELAIQTVALTKQYGNFTAVDSLNLEIRRGVVFGFLGPNGAGKTTTIRMLLGLVRPTSGSARVLGHDVETGQAQLCRRVGAIVETPSFYQGMTGAENLLLLCRTMGRRPDATWIDSLIERVGLAGREGDRVSAYSLGMRQRLGVAAALVGRPDMIFLDEPTNGLDPAGTIEMRDLIRGLADDGTTVLLSSHMMHEVEQVCSEVAILHRGVLRLQGKMSELVTQKDELFLQVSPVGLAAEVLGRFTDASIAREGEDELRLEYPIAEVPVVVAALVEAGVRVFAVRPQRQSLEDLFLSWTREALPAAGA